MVRRLGAPGCVVEADPTIILVRPLSASEQDSHTYEIYEFRLRGLSS